MSFNPLAIMLKSNKLTRPNYVDCKRNLDIVLTTEGYKYVLTEKSSDLSAVNVPKLEREIYEMWVKADEMARYYILISVSSIL